ncbi:ninjurin-2-like isoform X2 [Scyliorhinus canicula]|uniref:ninjurin-2-like isoform X2 n=1 Tax=Scyliorhinus canicula TaxID=7830 RepID=UPI0018F788C7|nr:ninjurin-2-like isoform X2 [Scyliorhinus canicula]
MSTLIWRNMHHNSPYDGSDTSADEEPLFRQNSNEESRINVIRNINTYARTKTIAQGFLDIALFTANASQMKHLLQQGPGIQFYYFLFVLLCISITLQLIVAALLIYKGSKNIECDDPERRLSDRKRHQPRNCIPLGQNSICESGSVRSSCLKVRSRVLCSQKESLLMTQKGNCMGI